MTDLGPSAKPVSRSTKIRPSQAYFIKLLRIMEKDDHEKPKVNFRLGRDLGRGSPSGFRRGGSGLNA